MPRASGKPFRFICGTADDDRLVFDAGVAVWNELTEDIPDDGFSREIIDGRVLKQEDVAPTIDAFQSALQTPSFLGGRKAIWFRSLSFLGKDRLGGAKGTQEAIEDLPELLANINPADTAVLITACPIDRVRRFYKAVAKLTTVDYIDHSKTKERDGINLIVKEAQRWNRQIDNEAAHVLWMTLAENVRLVPAEVEKLDLLLGPDDRAITVDDIHTATSPRPNDSYFRPVESFFQGNAERVEADLRDYFSIDKNDARPLLRVFQNQVRLALQATAAQNVGGFGRAEQIADQVGATEGRDAFNLFGQNDWAKRRANQRRFNQAQLIRIQQDLMHLFTQLMNPDRTQLDLFLDLVDRHLNQPVS